MNQHPETMTGGSELQAGPDSTANPMVLFLKLPGKNGHYSTLQVGHQKESSN